MGKDHYLASLSSAAGSTRTVQEIDHVLWLVDNENMFHRTVEIEASAEQAGRHEYERVVVRVRY